jgi:hypothetical protein
VLIEHYLSSNQMIELPLTPMGSGGTLASMVVASTLRRGHLGWFHLQREQSCVNSRQAHEYACGLLTTSKFQRLREV